MKLENVIILPSKETAVSRWDIDVEDGIIRRMSPSGHVTNKPSSLLLPSLCHPHVHLDKPYILTCNHHPPSASHPDYSDLAPDTGSFGEALSNTSKAKGRYTGDDLYLRGSQLLATSYTQGVTSLRAFVELDHVTATSPLTTAIRMKRDFAHLLDVQICAFAQDPIFSTAHGETNRSIISSALANYASEIHVLGTTPYVERSREASLQNIEWAIKTALAHGLHLDFHLDYNIESPPQYSTLLTVSVIDLLARHNWRGVADKSKTIALGHCTQLTMLPDIDLELLAQTIRSSELPIYFVGLPTSDLFMMGRPAQETDTPHSRPRGTLQVPSIIQHLHLPACIGVNNVGNAFTPFGDGDPLQLASWGVGIYHAGTVDDAETLYGCVSWRAREAIGLGSHTDGHGIGEGQRIQGMLLIENQAHIELPGGGNTDSRFKVPARQRVSFKDVVWDPPQVALRSIVS